MTRRIIDQMGENHDQCVLDWVNSLKSTISTNQVTICVLFIWSFNADFLQGSVARMQFEGLDNSSEYGSESVVVFIL